MIGLRSSIKQTIAMKFEQHVNNGVVNHRESLDEWRRNEIFFLSLEPTVLLFSSDELTKIDESRKNGGIKAIKEVFDFRCFRPRNESLMQLNPRWNSI